MDAIAIVDRNWGIAKEGKQFCHLPEDLGHFATLTKSRGGIVVYGRKTLEQLPYAKPLEGRTNYVLSKTLSSVDGATVYHDTSELPEEVWNFGWVIGGSDIYYKLYAHCERAIITRVLDNFDCDKFFPPIDLMGWYLEYQSKTLYSTYRNTPYRFEVWRNTCLRK